MKKSTLLVACEFSGVVREVFNACGWDAWSCDLLPTEQPGQHYEGDVLEIINNPGLVGIDQWDMMIAHPPCTYLSSSGLHWNKRQPERAAKTELALEFVANLWNAPIEKICIENPVGCINTRLPFMPKPQYIQPYEFGEDASKKTGLWLKNLPPLEPTDYIEPRYVDGKPRWANQSDKGQSRLGGGKGKERSVTYEGIAIAMGEQWSGI